MVRRVIVVGGRVAVLLAAAGCGAKPGPVAVSGVLRVDGRPVPGAVVLFDPQEPGRPPAYGTTDDTGAFRLTTTAPGDGAFPGRYKVVVQPPAGGGGATPFDDPSKPPPPPKPARGPRVPEPYTRADQTPLTQDVPPAGDVVLELKSR